MKFVNSQKGFSMIQAIIAFAIIAVISVTLMKIGSQAGKNQRGYFTAGDISQEVHKIERLLQDRRSCNNTFNAAIAMNNIADGATISINHFRDIANQIYILRNNTNYAPNFTITGITVTRGGGTEPWPNNMLEVKVTFKRKKASTGANEITKSFLVHAEFSGNIFQSCYTRRDAFEETSYRLLCEWVHKGTYDVPAGSNECSAPLAYGEFQLGANRTVTYAQEYDFCVLSRIKGEDAWKKSSTHECLVTRNPNGDNDKVWQLKAYKQDAYSTDCSMLCIKLLEGVDATANDGGDPDPPSEMTLTGLATEICEKLAEYYPDVLVPACMHDSKGILGNTHFSTAIGYPTSMTLFDLIDAEETSMLSTPLNYPNLLNCIDQLSNLTNSDQEVIDANPGTLPNYLVENLKEILPIAPNSCGEIFTP